MRSAGRRTGVSPVVWCGVGAGPRGSRRAGTVLRELGALSSVSDDARLLERERDLALGLGRQRQQRRAYGGVLELAALDEGQFEREGSFHVCAAGVDVLGDREKGVADWARRGVGVRLACC